MALTRPRSKVDANQAEIVKALRDVGATVQTLTQVGKGCPDILVGYKRLNGRHANYLMEIKHGKGQLTPDEHTWHQKWNGQVAVVRTVREALGIIGVEDE